MHFINAEVFCQRSYLKVWTKLLEKNSRQKVKINRMETFGKFSERP
jgi:hypothetical protein